MTQTLFSFQQLGRLQNTAGQQKHHNSFSSHANKIVASSILLENRAPSFIPAQLIGRLVPEWEAGFENFNVTTNYVLDKDVDEPQSRTGYFSDKSEFSTAPGFSKLTNKSENEISTRSTAGQTSGSGSNHGSDTPETYGNSFDSAPDSTPVSHEDSFFSGAFDGK